MRQTDNKDGIESLVSDRRVPWQLRFAGYFGVPALVCIYLVWWLTSSLDAQLKVIMNTQATIIQLQQTANSLQVDYRKEAESQTRILESIRSTQYQICVNGLEPGRDTRPCFRKTIE